MSEFDVGPFTSNDRNNRSIRVIAVGQDEPNYKMDRHKRTAVIFNHFKFDNGSHIVGVQLEDRFGTGNDVVRLEEVLKNLHFQVDVHNNKSRHEIQDIILKLSQNDFTDQDCLAIFVLTHGVERKLAARDYLYDPEDLWRFFTGENCPSLVGKPKLIFINACQGPKRDTGVSVTYDPDGPYTTDAFFYKIPCMADILLAFSSAEGYVSIRNPENGTWFIQSLCDNLSDDITGRMEIKEILTKTSRDVAYWGTWCNSGTYYHLNTYKKFVFKGR